MYCNKFIIASTTLINIVEKSKKDNLSEFSENIKKLSNTQRERQLESKDKNGNTPLLLAIIEKKEKLAKYILVYIIEDIKKPYYLFASNKEEKNFFHLAFYYNNPEIITTALIKLNKYINKKHLKKDFFAKKLSIGDNEGYTPIHLAIISDFDKIGIKLIEMGVNLEAIDENGANPLHWAMQVEDDENSNNEYGEQRKELLKEIIKNATSKVLLTKCYGKNKLVKKQCNNTPLHKLLKYKSKGFLEVAAIVIKKMDAVCGSNNYREYKNTDGLRPIDLLEKYENKRESEYQEVHDLLTTKKNTPLILESNKIQNNKKLDNITNTNNESSSKLEDNLKLQKNSSSNNHNSSNLIESLIGIAIGSISSFVTNLFVWNDRTQKKSSKKKENNDSSKAKT